MLSPDLLSAFIFYVVFKIEQYSTSSSHAVTSALGTGTKSLAKRSWISTEPPIPNHALQPHQCASGPASPGCISPRSATLLHVPPWVFWARLLTCMCCKAFGNHHEIRDPSRLPISPQALFWQRESHEAVAGFLKTLMNELTPWQLRRKTEDSCLDLSSCLSTAWPGASSFPASPLICQRIQVKHTRNRNELRALFTTTKRGRFPLCHLPDKREEASPGARTSALQCLQVSSDHNTGMIANVTLLLCLIAAATTISFGMQKIQWLQ